MNNLSNIVVYIKDETMLEEARRILLDNGQLLAEDSTFSLDNDDKRFNYLRIFRSDKRWYLSVKIDTPEITLTELEELLKKEKA